MLIEVAAAVLQRSASDHNQKDNTLAVRRSQGSMKGYWELPGGKREPGESMRNCLVREIREELGLHIQVGDLLGVNRHSSAGNTIELHAYLVKSWTGEIQLTVHDEMRWLSVGELDTVKWSAADIPLINLLK